MTTLAEHQCPTPNYSTAEGVIEFTFALGMDRDGVYTRCLGCGDKFRGFMPK